MTEIKTLSNGATLLLEHLDHVHSVAVGITLGVGSRHENAAHCGISHCLEHMVFKGTPNYTTAQLAAIMDELGGQFNAFTTKEATTYYAKMLGSHLDRGLNILLDMTFNALLKEEDLVPERAVIIEEIGMYEDSPEDLVGERLFEAIYPNQALGRPILGTNETLHNMTADDLRQFRDKYYRSPQLVVSVAGSFTQAHVDTITKALEALPVGQAVAAEAVNYMPAFITTQKPLEQNHLCLTLPGLRAGDEQRFIKNLMVSILGGGTSSRLYQTLREEHGLCYNVYANSVSFKDAGLIDVITACNKDTEQKALMLACDILTDLADKGPKQDELDRHREQLKANVLMGLESTSARMSYAARSYMTDNRVLTPDEIIAGYDAVTTAQVCDLMRDCLHSPSFSAVGKTADADEYRELIEKSLA